MDDMPWQGAYNDGSGYSPFFYDIEDNRTCGFGADDGSGVGQGDFYEPHYITENNDVTRRFCLYRLRHSLIIFRIHQ